MNEKIMSFKKAIIGNERIVNILEKSYKSKKLAHAYLFEGPDHIGKKTLAFAFCELILKNSFTSKYKINNNEEYKKYSDKNIKKNPDLLVLKPDKDKKQIIIEQVRDLQKKLSLYPYASKYKVAIIEQSDRMSETATNAILKTLEEPNNTTILILLTSNSENLLDTIKSRCQILKFLPIKKKLLNNLFKNKIDNQSKIEKIIELAGYRPGKIVEFINNNNKTAKLIDLMERFSNIIQKSEIEKLNEAEIVSKNENDEIVDLLDLYSFYFRGILLKEYKKETKINKNKILKIRDNLNLIDNVKKNILTKNVNIKLDIENLFLQF